MDPCQQKGAHQKENAQKDGGVSHTTSKLGHKAIQKSAYHNPNFFGHIIKTEKRGGIGGLWQKLGIGRT